jgi:cell division protein FtsA
VALVVREGVRYTGTLPIAGAHFTRDLAVGLRTPIDEAERIKREFGSALYEDVAEDDIIEVPGVGSRSPRPMPRRFACEILHHRAVELLEMVREQLDRTGASEQALAGVVITGGGSLLRGLTEISERVLGMPARQGTPQALRGLSEQLAHPACATAVGLAMLSCQEAPLHVARDARGAAPPWLVNRFLSWVGN